MAASVCTVCAILLASATTLCGNEWQLEVSRRTVTADYFNTSIGSCASEYGYSLYARHFSNERLAVAPAAISEAELVRIFIAGPARPRLSPGRKSYHITHGEMAIASPTAARRRYR